MTDDINYKNNPLHGLSSKALLTELVEHYGFEILFAYLNINCFKTNPSVDSSLKFIKKTEWARVKVENFYLYEFKSLPRASDKDFQLSPRDRIIPDGHVAGAPAKLSLEDAEGLRQKRAKKASEYNVGGGRNSYTKKPVRSKPRASTRSIREGVDPWANARKSSD